MPEREEPPQVQEKTVSYGFQDENGVDISLLIENLKLTPTERLTKAQKAMESVQRMKSESQLRP